MNLTTDGGTEDCIEIFSPSGQWNDQECTDRLDNICEKRTFTLASIFNTNRLLMHDCIVLKANQMCTSC